MTRRLTTDPITMPDLPTRVPKPRKGSTAWKNRKTLGWMGESDSDLYADLRRYREQEWRETAAAYEAGPGDFANAWHYLNAHPIFYRFQTWGATDGLPRQHERHLISEQGLDRVEVYPIRVDPRTGRRHRKARHNTTTRLFFEFGPVAWADTSDVNFHDHLLDGSATTYEKAIVKVARRVHRAYGNDRRNVPATPEPFKPAPIDAVATKKKPRRKKH